MARVKARTNDQGPKNTSPYESSILKWIPAQDGSVPAGAIAAGYELGNPNTYIGRCKICQVQFPNFVGHIPDNAIAFNDDKPYSIVTRSENYYVGRVTVTNSTALPGYIVPSSGVLRCSYDNRETTSADYEVLCPNTPSSLRYLAAKLIRDRVKERDRQYNAKYLTKINNAFHAIERIFFSFIKKNVKKKESSEDKLELPRSLISYLKSPKSTFVSINRKLDINTIMSNCCPPEENCVCQMWVEVTLQGLY